MRACSRAARPRGGARLDAGEVEPELGREPLDQAQPLEVGLGVEARVAGRALRPHEALLLVDAERLRVHADELGGDGDHVARACRPLVASRERVLARVLARDLLELLERLALRLRQLRRHRRAARARAGRPCRRRSASARRGRGRAGACRPASRRDLERDPALGRRHLDLGAERGLGVRDRNLEDEVGAPALVERRRRHARDDVEVAGGPPPSPARPCP